MTPSHRFSLAVSINAVACDITLNDVPVLRNYSGDHLDTVLPVGEFMVPGQNILKIRTLVDRSEGGWSATRATATLRATPYAASDWRPLFSVETRAQPAGAGEVTTETQVSLLGPVSNQTSEFDGEIQLLETARSIHLTAAVPAWAWLSSPPIPDDDEVRADLIAWYQGLFATIMARNDTPILAGLSEKITELGLAFGLASDAMAAEIGLPAVMRNSELTVQEVAWDELRMETAGQDRLVRLYHSRKGAVIRFTNALDLIHSFDLWLRRGPTGWVIAR